MMRRSWIAGATSRLLMALASVASLAGPLHGQDGGDADDAFRSGKYQDAIAIWSRVPPSDSGWLAAQRSLARAYATVGKYDEAESVARKATSAPGGAALWTTLGETLLLRGKRADAESAFVRAEALHAPDSLTAALDLAELHYDRGEHDRADKEFDRFIDVYNATLGASLTSEELVDVATAVEYLGANDPELFKDALKAFDRAVTADPENVDAHVKLGELFLRKYNFADAQTTFDQILETNPQEPRALVGDARRRDADGTGGADSLVRAALSVNPDNVDALTFRAELLLESEDYAAAQQAVERALRVNPTAGHALAVDAAIHYLTHDQQGFESLRQRALSLDPQDAEFYATLAELTAQVRLYGAAAAFAHQGTVLDPKDWHAWSVLGMNELRLGRIDSGKTSLETSFGGDPYNVWVKNTLDLLDTYKNYDLVSSGHFQFMIEKDEAPILAIYLEQLAEQAYAKYSVEYAYTPPSPIRIEVYRSHADFSVRTVGLAGLGALGVSFGTTLAFDSPAAKDAGPFNWGSTVWHELAHTFTLGMTDNRVPRWLSEGLSVYEEHHGQPGWGFHVSPGFLEAFKQGKLVPVSRMNDGFMHPAYAEQVQYSYFQASLVCELIARDYGQPALLAMLRGYKDGMTTAEVFERVLHTDLPAFDKTFDEYLRTRYAAVLPSITPEPAQISASSSSDALIEAAKKSPNDFGVQLLAGSELVSRGDGAAGIPMLEHAREIFPEYGGDDSPYAVLATAYRKSGDLRKEADVLTAWTSLTETNLGALEELSAVLEKLGDVKGAADALDRAMYINPFDIPMHEKLAELSHRAGESGRAVREREAILALGPVDRAEALYELAAAQHDAGDDVHARTTVLRALEGAPDFEKAQTLLLTLYDARQSGGAKKP